MDDLDYWQRQSAAAFPQYPLLELRVISHDRPQGQLAAVMKGIMLTKGRNVLTLDPDQYSLVAEIPAMLEKIRDGAAIVQGVRTSRANIGPLRRAGSLLANGMVRLITGLHIADVGCPMTLTSREAIDWMKQSSYPIGNPKLLAFLLFKDRLVWHPLPSIPEPDQSHYTLGSLYGVFLHLMVDAVSARRSLGQLRKTGRHPLDSRKTS